MEKQKLIDIALAEVGYLEKKSNADLDDKTANAGSKNFTKYARDLASYPYFNGSKRGVAWCSVFVAWCFVQAFGKDEAVRLLCQPVNPKSNCGAGCGYARGYFKSKGQLHDVAEEGDVIFFWSKDKTSVSHTGIVYKIDSDYLYTVEGNTNGANGVVSNGGGVCCKKYKKTYARLAGFGRPDYTEAPIPETAPEVDQGVDQTTSTIRKGDWGDDVRNLQEKLVTFGYSLVVDGIFGDKTKSALIAFQKVKGLSADGICGPDTWNALNTEKVPGLHPVEPSESKKLDILWKWYMANEGAAG